MTPAAVAADSDTFDNARLWDYRPLGDTLNQLQTIRQYYDFYDVDTDRYNLDGQLKQVMLSGREMALDKNPNATGWVNQRLVYTHGFGVAMVPVNAVTSQGQPALNISNLPPASTGGAPQIDQPRIYFGERPSPYVIVGAVQDEFDYPRGSSDNDVVQYRWTGTTGIKLDTTLTRLLFALRFRDFDMLISNQITDQSQLLMNRSIGERLQAIAPFLRYDKDPYLVIVDAEAEVRPGRVHDERPVPERPVVQPVGPRWSNRARRRSVQLHPEQRQGRDGRLRRDDDVLRRRPGRPVDPGLVRGLPDAVPARSRRCRRTSSRICGVPEELFDVQTRMFGRYHVVDPTTFYTNNDLWTVPMGQTNQQSLPTEAYYVIMRMPGTDKADFLILQPMIPSSRPNMIAWVAARNGPVDYGKTTVFQFPSQTSVFGPAQVEAQIDIDPEISAQITLWNQSGSTVVRGNLIVLPGRRFADLSPARLSRIEQLEVPGVRADRRRVVYRTSSGRRPWPAPSTSSSPRRPAARPARRHRPRRRQGPAARPRRPRPRADRPVRSPRHRPASRRSSPTRTTHFELAEAALRNGDFATYGAEIELVRQALTQLEQLTGGALPSGAPARRPPPRRPDRPARLRDDARRDARRPPGRPRSAGLVAARAGRVPRPRRDPPVPARDRHAAVAARGVEPRRTAPRADRLRRRHAGPGGPLRGRDRRRRCPAPRRGLDRRRDGGRPDRRRATGRA